METPSQEAKSHPLKPARWVRGLAYAPLLAAVVAAMSAAIPDSAVANSAAVRRTQVSGPSPAQAELAEIKALMASWENPDPIAARLVRLAETDPEWRARILTQLRAGGPTSLAAGPFRTQLEARLAAARLEADVCTDCDQAPSPSIEGDLARSGMSPDDLNEMIRLMRMAGQVGASPTPAPRAAAGPPDTAPASEAAAPTAGPVSPPPPAAAPAGEAARAGAPRGSPPAAPVGGLEQTAPPPGEVATPMTDPPPPILGEPAPAAPAGRASEEQRRALQRSLSEIARARCPVSASGRVDERSGRGGRQERSADDEREPSTERAIDPDDEREEIANELRSRFRAPEGAGSEASRRHENAILDRAEECQKLAQDRREAVQREKSAKVQEIWGKIMALQNEMQMTQQQAQRDRAGIMSRLGPLMQPSQPSISTTPWTLGLPPEAQFLVGPALTGGQWPGSALGLPPLFTPHGP